MTDPAKRSQVLTCELDVLDGAAFCDLYFNLINGSGVFRPGIAPGRISGYELEAQ